MGEPSSTAETPRRDLGTVEQRGRRWYGRVSLPQGQRPWVPLGEDMSEARAREKLAALIERGRETGQLEALVARLRERMAPRRKLAPATPVGGIRTVRELGEAWTSGELLKRHGQVNGLREKASADVDAWRLGRMYELRPRGPKGPTFGELDVSDVRETDVERVLAEAPGEDASQATRTRFYSLLHRLFDLAIVPARLRKESPVTRHQRPPKGAGKLFSYLYPPELLAVLKAPSIPLGRRVFYALAVYTGQRKSSLYALRWRDVDLVHGGVSSLVQKNQRPQPFAISPDLVRLLKAWREASGNPGPDEPVVRGLDVKTAQEAKALRADLEAAGVARAELFGGDPQIEPLRFHDMRATFVTWAKRAGKGEGWITDRTGHLDPSQVARYTRATRKLEEHGYEPFPSLDGAIPGLSTYTSTPPGNEDLGREGEGSGEALAPGNAPSGTDEAPCGSSCRGFDPRYSPRGSPPGFAAPARAIEAGTVTGPGSGRSCGALPLVAALLLAACGGVQAGRAEPDTRPEAAREPRGETRRACEARCRRVVETRHDACGLGAGRPWPDWCAEDNARWQTECELDCRAKSAR